MTSKQNIKMTVAECSLCVALSYIMSKVNLFTMPNGGSIDFELVPLILFTYRRGWKWGVTAGFIEGLLRIMLRFEPTMDYILPSLLDYVIAYSFVGMTDLHPFWLGLIVAWAGMTASSVVSGVLFYAQYAPEGQNVWVYSFMYNAPVLGAKYLISGIAALILWKLLERELAF